MAHPNVYERDVPRAPPGRVSGHTLSMPISHTQHDIAIAKMAQADISLEQRELDLLSPAYMLEWEVGHQGCARKRIGDAEQLRATIVTEIKGDRLFVFQDLPAEYLDTVRDELGVDARFLEAHAGRRVYRPLMKRGWGRADVMDKVTREKSDFACFEYPEMLTLAKRAAVTGGRPTSSVDARGAGDIAGEAPTYAMSNDGEYVMFCRASLWLSDRKDVLLLDPPSWARSSSMFRKAIYPSSGPSHTCFTPITRKEKGDSIGSDTLHSEPTPRDRDDIPSLETLLYQSLAEEVSEKIYKAAAIEDIAIHQWHEFFDALPTDLKPGTAETTALYKQVQKSLERNLTQSQFRDKISSDHRRPSSATTVWESLLARLSRHLALLSYLNPPPPPTLTSSPSNPRSRAQLSTAALPPATSHRPSSEQNQQSLDRVSYMGGVLLPLSIVSSILSMSDPFGPGNSQFFVFWAVSIPLVFITILIIYADSIRKAEVWIEVASSGSTTGSEKRDEEEGGSMPEFEGGMGLRARRRTDGVGVEMCESDYGDGFGEWDGPPPGMIVERLFKDAGKKKWRREQLGWMGACKAVFRIYKLKQGRPPNWATNVRRGNTV
ncbi:uncharacterized protein GGS22DRAFT_163443 [Annulohypoxylon maeteangense]|uniref:uncharacterized protein n=1 Tax=Annulohypoxylon maeteangense TaxID=1927788 RepID=UPI002007B8B3|nr:uncharacterized protein GGS22DRAFT_163443 [Annulohypoxylon maeteangense]KAI0885330.1 hypothetical protein GGS22DRAFT_163443 [Annulohypoxylon maeteangense]